MTGAESERTYQVSREPEGIYVTEVNTGVTFFRTDCGGWFFVQGEASPFDEDIVVPPEYAKYLSGLVETLDNVPKSLQPRV